MENISRILKICFAVWLHAIIFICCKSIALAAPSGQDLYDFYQENYYSTCGITTTVNDWNTYINSCPNYSSYDKIYMGLKQLDYAGTAWQFILFGCSDNQVVSVSGSNFTVNSGTMRVFYSKSNKAEYSNYSDASTFSGGVQNWVSEVVVMDFSNVMYDPSIPTPIFSVYYNDDSNTMPRFNLDVELQNASDDYYVYVTMDNSTPIRYGIAYDGQMYNVSYHKFATREIVTRQSLTQSDTLSMNVLSGLLSAGWRADINTIEDSDIEVSAISDGAYFSESSASFIAWKTQLLTFRKIALFYGNSNTISVQYFKIVDGNVYAGEIKSWNNLNGGTFTVTIPKYYIPNNPANGFEVITIDRPLETANPLTTIPDNQFGYRTGGDIIINTGSNVPNYPDYPTIATYNLDNILVSTIDNAKDLGGFFTEVSAFCVATFAWIPREIWQIIALGFALSIVVMFVKIL